MVTLIDRTSRFNLLVDLPEDHGAESVLACLVELFDRVAEELAHPHLGSGARDGPLGCARRSRRHRRVLRRASQPLAAPIERGELAHRGRRWAAQNNYPGSAPNLYFWFLLPKYKIPNGPFGIGSGPQVDIVAVATLGKPPHQMSHYDAWLTRLAQRIRLAEN